MIPSVLHPSVDDIHGVANLVEQVRTGNVRAASRLITVVENHPESGVVLRLLHDSLERATVIGVTGYPGAGKSTVVDRLVNCYRRNGSKIGVLAVDVSSPITGGALLGDRIRMQEHALDQEYSSGAWPLAGIMEDLPEQRSMRRWYWKRPGTG